MFIEGVRSRLFHAELNVMTSLAFYVRDASECSGRLEKQFYKCRVSTQSNPTGQINQKLQVLIQTHIKPTNYYLVSPNQVSLLG